MSTQGCPPPASLPPLPDEASVPFSSLFDNFDLATVDSTVQFANRGIFIASDGRRYLFQSIPESDTPTASPTKSTAPSSIQPVTSPRSPHELHGHNNASPMGRQMSNASSRSQASSFRTAHSERYNVSPAALDLVVGPPPAITQDVTNMMSHLNINSHFNGAAPYFGESDGGVGLAEVLTERDTDPWIPESPVDNRPVSPRTASNQHCLESHHSHNQSTYMRTSTLTAGMSTPAQSIQTAGHQVDGINYGGFVTGANFASSQGPRRQAPPTGPVLESLMEFSYPQYPASPASPIRHSSMPYSPTSPVLAPDYEKEFVDSDGAYVYSSSPHSVVHVPSSPHHDRGRGGSGSGVFVGAAQNNLVNIGTSTNQIDTRTAIVVVPERHDSSFSSDIKSAPTLASSAFEDGELKIFRNTTTKDLRFHCRVGTYSETFWIKARNAQLIPVYAYDPRFLNVICLHDKETEKGNPGYLRSSPIPGGTGNGHPNGIYQFPRLENLCNFQAQLTGEKVLLDISNVKLIRLSKANNGANDTYSSVRLQIWHEDPDSTSRRRGMQSDKASFVTAGTALSGPLRDKQVASSSKLIVYLGRLGEYVQTFITDDIEVKAEGQTKVKLRPRKAGVFSREGSRWKGIKAHIEQRGDSEMAGFNIDGQPPNPDEEYSYDLYKMFEIEFENPPSQDSFIRRWGEVIANRRQQKRELEKIQEKLRAEGGLYGKTAMQIRM
ncbi:hypothetical protein NEUTE1DRAFT_121876 [Neurospora tetrasperma FGSC 2508]|uniref:Uncharacterized protein n=1 Tax=Neurospora tetrasperma (strain FGSC 2508 / ATCC MYA-4615 / P0657) TaxID=510951 RepID=F8MKM3_NEUT8|nr:uncharacterized protein NEUTE1DRAFT_121876 [Neurospora tetrasperma FGSC 2508]EGO57453.1 hypothetical protein NEUTE1DRAFT_121876 [Neurospora tetrasperma FGSC 2508]EGZ72289.1 hypothetical protein NEUTE2DRAFT_90397 [Neurospora tetrasperma FGSC 2509]